MIDPDPRQLVRGMWEAFEAHDWDGARALLADDAVVEWPHSGERFTSAASFIEMNRRHPAPNWHIVVKRIVAEGDTVVSEVWVPTDAQPAFVTSFFAFADGKITRITEYWLDCEPEAAQWCEGLRELYDPER
ncbi:MAG TPA: nuclear transport factor 2 family protein [Actinomycetota bacterium]|nr:nuclear transport factor 2 family protein [Actinomycetota bacterium]